MGITTLPRDCIKFTIKRLIVNGKSLKVYGFCYIMEYNEGSFQKGIFYQLRKEPLRVGYELVRAGAKQIYRWGEIEGIVSAMCPRERSDMRISLNIGGLR